MLQVKVFVFSPIQENTYVLYNGQGNCCIVDPGCYFDFERQDLENFIRNQHLTVKYLLNTHCHLDHVFGNKFAYDTWAQPVHLHQESIPVLQMAPASAQLYNMPFENYTGPTFFLKEGDTIKLDEDELTVIEAPGHAPGHICFYCEKQKIIVGGDVLFRTSIGRTDLPGGNHELLLKNIREKLFILPDDVKVYPGHGEPTTIGYEKQHNPFVRYE